MYFYSLQDEQTSLTPSLVQEVVAHWDSIKVVGCPQSHFYNTWWMNSWWMNWIRHCSYRLIKAEHLMMFTANCSLSHVFLSALPPQ